MDGNDAMEIDYKCYDLRNDIKSEMTKQIYLEPRLYPIHNKIREWYNYIINNIYTNPNIKQEIFKFITNNITNDVELNTFLDSTLGNIELEKENLDERKKMIVDRFKEIPNQLDINRLLRDTLIYDLFFIIYLKGGIATRYMCMYINTLSGAEMFSLELQKEVLGDVSDYDFNCMINPALNRKDFNIFLKLLIEIINNSIQTIISNDPYLKDPTIKQIFLECFNKTIQKFPIITPSMCSIVENPISLGVGSFSDNIGNLFGLMRLMLKMEVRCKGTICFKDEDGKSRNSIPFLAELIDISIPVFDNVLERQHAWMYANKSISLKWCDIASNRCDISDNGNPNRFNDRIRVYSLQSVLDDITNVIRDTTARGDTSKLAKRQNRLNFLQKLLCFYTLVIKGNRGTLKDTEISGYCVSSVEQFLCPYEYIDTSVSQYLSILSIGEQQHHKKNPDLIFRVAIKFTRNLLEGSDIQGYYKTELLFTYMNDLINTFNKLSVDARKQINPSLCKLVISTYHMFVSLNDNFIRAFIAYYYLATLSLLFVSNYDLFLIQVTNFSGNIIAIQESANNYFTRPFFRKNFEPIIEEIWVRMNQFYQSKPNEKCHLLVRGGCAFHYNIARNQQLKKTFPSSYNSNDLDLIVCVDNFNSGYDIANNLISAFNSKIEETKRENPALFKSLSINLELSRNQKNVNDYICLIVSEYDNPNNTIIPINTSAGPVTFQKLIPKIKHHILDCHITTDRWYSLDQIHEIKPQHNNIRLDIYNEATLIKQYYEILNEPHHWYRKSKYLRRIAALQGAITDKDVRLKYESEFPGLS